MTKPEQSFRLFVEHVFHEAPEESSPLHDRIPARPGSRGPSWIEIPSGGVFYLTTPFGDAPRVSADAGAVGSGAILFESVRHEGQPYLAMLFPPDRPGRVNGLPIPPAAVLRERDTLELEGLYVLHVSLFNRPYIGQPADDVIGKVCPVCLKPISKDTTIYVCPNCKLALHHEGEEKSDEIRLECVRFSSSCPCCGNPVVLNTEGYCYVPEI